MSRGLRNCNPGNIRLTGRTGLYRGEKSPSSDPAFRQFQAMEWGYRALFVLLYTYRKRYGLKTPREVISRWAPPHENHTEQYIRALCHDTGLEADEPFEISDQTTMCAIAASISRIENGIPAREEEVARGWELFWADYAPAS